MAVGVLGASGVGPGGSSTAYTVPGGISYAVVHVYKSGGAVATANGSGMVTPASLVLGPGQSIGLVSTANPLSFAPGSSIVVSGYEIP